MRIYVVGTVATIAVHHIATDIVISVLDVNFASGCINWHVKTVILGQVESGPACVGKLYKMEARVDSESNTIQGYEAHVQGEDVVPHLRSCVYCRSMPAVVTVVRIRRIVYACCAL